MRFKTIDGLRGIAALAVVVFHLHGATKVAFGDWLPSLLDRFFAAGHYGVDIFFVISGFVIAFSIRSAAPTWGFVGRFALRRSIRLDPPYWTAIALELAVQALALRLGFSEQPLPSLAAVAAHFLYLQNLLGLGNVVDVFWTLCFEIQFYLALITFFVLHRQLADRLGARTAQTLAIAVLGASFVYSLAGRFGLGGLHVHPGFAAIRWYQFLLGALVWWTVDRKVGWAALPLAWALVATTVLGVGASAWELLPIAVSALIFAAHRHDGMSSWLSSRPLQFLGAISYSLYVFHATIGWRFIRLVGVVAGEKPSVLVPVVAFTTGIALCIAFAWLAWRAIEGPSLTFSKRVELPKRSSPAPSSAS